LAYSTTILNQLLNLLRGHDFENAVSACCADRYVKYFNTWQQLIVLLYAQASGKDSLRAIQNGLSTHPQQLYHLGLSQPVAKSTLADANARCPYRVFETLFYSLLKRCSALAPQHGFRFKNRLVSLDATTIELCLSAFPWAKYKTLKGALKLHCSLDHRGNIPDFVVITDGKHYETTVARAAFPIVPDSIYCFDRGYTDFIWYQRIQDKGAFFVTRAKDNLKYAIAGQQSVLSGKGVISGTEITPQDPQTKRDYPGTLRLIEYYDEENDRLFRFLTNNFALAASTIVKLQPKMTH